MEDRIIRTKKHILAVSERKKIKLKENILRNNAKAFPRINLI